MSRPRSARADATHALVTGGGTGGHVYPALAVADELVRRGHDHDTIRFVGSARGIEATAVPAAGYRIDLLPGRGLRRSLRPAALWANLGAAVATMRAVVRGVADRRARAPPCGLRRRRLRRVALHPRGAGAPYPGGGARAERRTGARQPGRGAARRAGRGVPAGDRPRGLGADREPGASRGGRCRTPPGGAAARRGRRREPRARDG